MLALRAVCRTMAGALLAATASCAADASPSTGERSSALIYGEDDRRDYFDVTSEPLRELLARSTVAFVDRSLVESDASGSVRIAAPSYGESQGVCAGEPFADQPSAAQCSGVLIARDLVLTAAHCVRRVACSDWRLVFGFYQEAPEQLRPLRESDVYACAEVASMSYARSGSATEVDHAVVVLDRPVDDERQPVTPDLLDEPMRVGEPIAVIGHPAGLPGKVDGGGRVADVRADSLDYFLATSDTFDGSSGSGVYDADHKLRGLLARGGDDYEASLIGECRRVRREPDDLSVAEEKVTYLARALDGLCASQYRRAELCGPTVGSGCSVAATHTRGGTRAIFGMLLVALGLVLSRIRRCRRFRCGTWCRQTCS